MKMPVFVGSSTAIITPFKNDFVDYDKLAELIDFQIENGTSAITICGTTGEASTQTTPEHLATIEFCVKHVNGRVPVIAGTGSNDTSHAVMMSQSAEQSGADALLIVTPYYNKTSQTGLIKHYEYIADRVRIPIILYNVPSRTGMSITADTYVELSKHPNINGVKEASGNLTLISDILNRCGDELNVWSGDDQIAVPMMSIGAKGVISVASNIVPDRIAKLMKLCLDGDFKSAGKMHLELIDLMNALFIETNPIPVKTALNLMGFNVGHLRMPLYEMSEKNKAYLKKIMIDAGIEIKSE